MYSFKFNTNDDLEVEITSESSFENALVKAKATALDANDGEMPDIVKDPVTIHIGDESTPGDAYCNDNGYYWVMSDTGGVRRAITHDEYQRLSSVGGDIYFNE